MRVDIIILSFICRFGCKNQAQGFKYKRVLVSFLIWSSLPLYFLLARYPYHDFSFSRSVCSICWVSFILSSVFKVATKSLCFLKPTQLWLLHPRAIQRFDNTNWIPSLNFSTTIQVNRLCFCDEIDKNIYCSQKDRIANFLGGTFLCKNILFIYYKPCTIK